MFINSSLIFFKNILLFPPKNKFHIGTLGLILCANTPDKRDTIREHICGDFWPFLHAGLFRILGYPWIPPSSVQTIALSWALSLETEVAITENVCCFYMTISVWIFMYAWKSLSWWTIYLWPTVSFQGRGNQIICQDVLVLCWIHCAINFK